MSFVATRSLDGDLTNALEYFVVSSGVTVTANEVVTIVAGFLEPAEAGERLLGVPASTVAGDGVLTVGVLADPDTVYLADANAALVQSDVGSYFDIADAGTVDETPAMTTSGQLVCLAINPFGDGAATGLFRISEHRLDSAEF